jgi:hypothetical protein
MLKIIIKNKCQQKGKKMNKLKILCSIFLLFFVYACNEEPTKVYKINETVQTSYFEVIISSVKILNSVETGNEFTRLPQEAGIKYLIIDIRFKNIDKEARMLVSGELILIDKQGKQYVFDNSETILSDDFGLFLDTLNPMLTKRTKLVYKIPSNFTGTIYYKPGRNFSNDVIDLGSR